MGRAEEQAIEEEKMSFLGRLFGFSAKGQSAPSTYGAGTIQVPRTEPGWNINAEEYFRKELKPLTGNEIRVILRIVDEEDGGFDETNLLYSGYKVGQLPNTYHKRLGSVLRDLRSKGMELECMAYVSKELEIKLLAPFPDKLIPFIRGTGPIDSSELQSNDRKSIRLKETDKHQTQLKEIWQKMDSADWSGSVTCKRYKHSGGKYDGQDGVEVFAEDVKIGSIGPRYVDDLAPIFADMEKGKTEFECRISLSQFEEGKLYATIFADAA